MSVWLAGDRGMDACVEERRPMGGRGVHGYQRPATVGSTSGKQLTFILGASWLLGAAGPQPDPGWLQVGLGASLCLVQCATWHSSFAC